MALVAGHRSTLNPNAPVFIPVVYRQVEDFSPEWWDLVKTSTWFRDYWLSKNPAGSFDGSAVDDVDDGDFVDLLPENIEFGFEEFADMEDQLEEMIILNEEQQKKKLLDGAKLDLKGIVKELNIPNRGKENVKSPVKAPKYQMKAVSPKSAPRQIHQIHQPR